MRLVIIVIFFLTFSFKINLANSQVWERTKEDSYSLFSTTGYLLKAPVFSWGGSDWLIFSSIFAGSAAFALLDKDIKNLGFFKNRSPNKDDMQKVGSAFGTFGFIGPISGAIFLDGLFTGNSWARQTGTLMISSLLISHLICHLGKFSFGRSRPNHGHSQYVFKPFNKEPKFHSLPSGHVSYAMTAAMVMATQMEAYSLKAFFYGLGLLGGFARIYDRAHWPSDVLFTSLVSYFIVEGAKKHITRKNGTREQKGEVENSYYFIPTYNSLSFVYEW